MWCGIIFVMISNINICRMKKKTNKKAMNVLLFFEMFFRCFAPDLCGFSLTTATRYFEGMNIRGNLNSWPTEYYYDE